jgi:acyl-coenzyme A synthetase/AMP-(fatty) acid ligase
MTTGLREIVRALECALDQPLVEYRGQYFTGAALLARVHARVADLRQMGLKQGDTALIIVTNNLSAMEQLLACWYLGAAGAFVDFRVPTMRINECQERLKPALTIASRSVAGVPVHVQPHDLAPVTGTLSEPCLDTELTALYFSSSGSTGLPSLLPRSQGRIGDLIGGLYPEIENFAPGAMLAATSLAYSASVYRWLCNLARGRLTVALDLVHGLDEIDTALRRIDVVEASLPPTLIRRLVALPVDTSPRYPQLKRLTSVGGPALPEDKLAALTKLTPSYEMTYSAVGIGLIARITGPEIVARPTSCGRPKDPVQVEIVVGDRICTAGEVGEIVVTTPRVQQKKPGDLGWLDADGYLHVVGRVQGLLCRNGVNFNAERLISTALALSGVEEAGIVSLTDADGGDEIHLIVQAAQDLAPALTQHMRQMLPAAEQPDQVHFCAVIPLNAAGKIDQRLLDQLLKDLLNAPVI